MKIKTDTQEEKLKNLWKVFGMETEAGKKLFQMYNKGRSVTHKINYPKVIKN